MRCTTNVQCQRIKDRGHIVAQCWLKIAKSSITQRVKCQRSRSQHRKCCVFAKLLLSFGQLGSLNLMTMSQFHSKAPNGSFVLTQCKFSHKQPRTTCATSCGLQVAMHSQLPLFLVSLYEEK